MFAHRTTISRVSSEGAEMVDGVVFVVPSNGEYKEIDANAPCRWSFSGKRINTVNSDGREQLLVVDYKVFFKRGADVQRGDILQFHGKKYLVHNIIPIYNMATLHHLEAEVVSYEQ